MATVQPTSFSLHTTREHYTAKFDEVAAALGFAISCWSDVESELSDIFVHSLNVENLGPPSAAYYGVVGFHNKLQMTDAALRYLMLHEAALRKDWGNLINRLTKQSKSRNKLAHGRVVGMSEIHGQKQRFLGYWYYPYFGLFHPDRGVFRMGRSDLPPMERYTAKQLHQIADGYMRLSGSLAAFRVDPRFSALGRPKKRPR